MRDLKQQLFFTHVRSPIKLNNLQLNN